MPVRMRQFELRSIIASGGMGTVYRAFDTMLHRQVAVKMLKKELAEDQEVLASFYREARAGAALNHTNIIHTYTFDEIEGQPYLGVEFVYAARAEMATSLVDLLTRRTRAHLHDARATLGASSAIARLVARDLGWDQVEQDRQVAEYDQLVRLEFHAAGLVL